MEGDHNTCIYWKQMAPNVIHGRQDDVLIAYMNLYKPLIGASFGAEGSSPNLNSSVAYLK